MSYPCVAWVLVAWATHAQGRAGRAGRVTSLYVEEDVDLVEAVRACVAAGEPVEGAFSRKRMFRKKFKKFGPSRRGVARN